MPAVGARPCVSRLMRNSNSCTQLSTAARLTVQDCADSWLPAATAATASAAASVVPRTPFSVL